MTISSFFSTLRKPYISFIGSLMIGLVLMILSIGIYLISNFYESGMLFKDNFNLLNNLNTTHSINIQVLQMITLFVVPPLVYSFFHKSKFKELFFLNKAISIQQVAYGVVLALAIFPVLLFIQEWVTSLPLPSDLKAIAEEQKLMSEHIIKSFLDFTSPLRLLLMLAIMGFGAGVTEELFFRGLMMPIISRFFGSIWLGIVLSGLFFGMMHSSVYDFLPISIIGMLFGYIYYKTNNLWVTIFIHSFYNGSQVFLNYLYNIKAIQFDIDNLDNIPIFVVFPCAALSFFIIQKITKNYSYE